MKKLFIVLLVALLLAGCSRSEKPVVHHPAPEAAKPKALNVQEPFQSFRWEITVKSVAFVQEAPLHIEGHNIYAKFPVAADGNVLLDICVEVKNMEQDATGHCDFIAASFLYNDKYTYRAKEYQEDYTLGLQPTGVLPSTLVYVEPLETVELRYFAEVPDEVGTNSALPLVLNITAGDDKYVLTVR